jgi:hypothetical protein
MAIVDACAADADPNARPQTIATRNSSFDM